MTARYSCPACGRVYLGAGRLGQGLECACGGHIPARLSDPAIRTWILRIAALYGFAVMTLSIAVFHRDLPVTPWERLFSPPVWLPTSVVWVAVYQVATFYKKKEPGDAVLFRLYLLGMLLFLLGFVSTLVAEKLG